MDAEVFSEALRAVDEAINAEAKRPAAPEAPRVPPIDAHIAELHEAMVRHNAKIETAQLEYAEDVTASRARLDTAQNELRAAERELAARWHGETT
jgi:hypothetical protein